MSEISIVSVDGKNYLGIVSKTKKGNTVVSEAMKFSGEAIDSSDVKRYLTDKNVGKLVDLTFDGNGTVVSRDLTDEEVLQYKMLDDSFTLIKATALKRLENDYFTKDV